MAITTLDGALAGMIYPVEFVKGLTGTMVAGRPMSTFLTAGLPGAAAVPSPGIGGEVVTSYAGQLPFTNPVSGNTYLARLQGGATIAGSLLLCDRLWHNSGITMTSTEKQTFTASAQIPARDSKGETNGVGVFAAAEIYTKPGAGTPTLTLGYKNTAGEAKTATNINAVVANSIAGTFYPIGLAAGDTGVQRATDLTLSATMTEGSMGIVLYRVLARLEITETNTSNAIDALTSGFPRLYNNTTPFLVFIPQTTTTSIVSGHMIVTQG